MKAQLSDDFRTTLRRDGWQVLAAEQDGEFVASHPLVHDETSARFRLDRLGMLISGAVRIGFPFYHDDPFPITIGRSVPR